MRARRSRPSTLPTTTEATATGEFNRLVMSAVVAEIGTLRFTPAGLPAIDLQLQHESTQEEAGQARLVAATLKAVAFGAMAERLAGQQLGGRWRFEGFLASPRNGKHSVLHITEFRDNAC